MADSEINVVFGADVSGLNAGTAAAAQSVDNCMSSIKSSNASMAKDFGKSLAPMGSAWDRALGGMLGKTMNFAKARQTIEMSAMKMTENLGVKAVDSFIGSEAKKVVETQLTTGQMSAIKAAASSADMAKNAASAMSQVASSSAVANAGTVAYLAPVMGPAAVGEGAAVGAEVMGLGSIASAAGGYDIPGGVNPVTQLHQNEMVLPADLADNVRNMTGNPGMTVHIHAMDAPSMKSFMERNGSFLMNSLNRQARQFNYGKFA